jgi:DNA-binding response OmpR family regulator
VLEKTRRVWIVDADQWPRAYLRAELIERGYDAVGFATLREAVAELTPARSARPEVIVFDLHDQILDDKLAVALFGEGIPIVALGGNVEWNDRRVRGRGWVAFLQRPITIGDIADRVDKLVRTDRGHV